MSFGSRKRVIPGKMIRFGCAFLCIVHIVGCAGVEQDAWTIVLETPTVRIGAVLGRAEYEFQEISDAAFLPDGQIVVVDARGRVAVFSSDGDWVRDLGGQGSGPGEYRRPTSVDSWRDTIGVWDPPSRRYSYWSAGGSFLASVRIEAGQTRAAKRTPGGFLLELEEGQGANPAPATSTIILMAPSGAIADTILPSYPVPEFSWRETSGGSGVLVNPPIFAVWPTWDAMDNDFAWTSGAEPQVRLSSGALDDWKVLEIPVEPPGPVTELDRRAYFHFIQNEQQVPEQLMRRIEEETDFANVRPLFTDLLLDDLGRVWLAGFAPETLPGRNPIGSMWFVFSPERRTMNRVDFADGFVLMDVRNHRAVGRMRTSDGVHIVTIFDLPEQ